MMGKGASNRMRISTDIQGRTQPRMETEKTIPHPVGRCLGGAGDFRKAGLLLLLKSDQFMEGLGFDGIEFIFAVENGFEGFLLEEQAFGDLDLVAVPANPWDRIPKVGM